MVRSIFHAIFWVSIRLVCLAALSVPQLAGQQQATSSSADIILHNGKILTVDEGFSTAQAVAIRGQQITAVGQNQEILRLAGASTQVIDLKGRTVIPGLIDTHRHIHGESEGDYGGDTLGPEETGTYLVDWRGVRNKDDVLNQVRGLMDKYKFPPGQWIYFINQLTFNLPAGEPRDLSSTDQAKVLYDELNRWELDKVTPNNPIVMSLGIPNFNGFLVNGKALDIIWKDHGDFIKKYGRYWVDSAGRPEGHLEPPASRLLFPYLPKVDPALLAPAYKKKAEELNASGVTTVSTRLPEDSAKTYQLLESRGELTLRMPYGEEWLFGTITDLDKDLKPLASRIGRGSDMVWVVSIAPTAVDGASTRACTDQKRAGGAYGPIDSWWPMGQCHNDIEFRGSPGKAASFTGNYYKEWNMTAGRYGLRQANNHVAGDRSVAVLLNHIEEIQKQIGPAATKNWAFDHCEFVNPADFQRGARLGVIFSCAPKYLDRAQATADAYGEKVANTFVAPFKSLLNAGAKVVFETDRNTYVWKDIEQLITRKDYKGKVWGPQERLDRPTALKTITRWAAEYVLKPEKLGSIEPGKLADLVVLDRDYMTIPEEEISEIQPQLTIFDGKIAFVHSKFAQEYNLRPAGAVVSTYQDLLARKERAKSLREGGG